MKPTPGSKQRSVLLETLQSKTMEPAGASPWRRFACTNAAEREELRRLAVVIEEEFERIEPEDEE